MYYCKRAITKCNIYITVDCIFNMLPMNKKRKKTNASITFLQYGFVKQFTGT